MTCPHCQTWILDDDHRCRRCGRRLRTSAPPSSSARFPISADATARDYQYDRSILDRSIFDRSIVDEQPDAEGQAALFSNPNPSRIVPIGVFASPAERENIRARAAEAARPEPLKQATVEGRHARPRRKVSPDQQVLDFFGAEEVLSRPQSNIICDAPVAPNSLRIQASVIDGLIMLAGMALIFSAFVYLGGPGLLDKHSLPFLMAALITVPLFYKGMWAYANRDSYGTTAAGLRIVDFDGNPPSHARRYQRLLGSFVSVLAAGMGLIWALVDEDSLTWHDHISNTFPTLADE
jgi:uncharacterized RDD family membrane protein YckC